MLQTIENPRNIISSETRLIFKTSKLNFNDVSTHAIHPSGTHPMTNSMYRELFQFLLKFLLKFLGIGLRGFGEFEDEISYRLKINSRIQKEKADGLPLFDGTIQSVRRLVVNLF